MKLEFDGDVKFKTDGFFFGISQKEININKFKGKNNKSFF